MSRSQRLETELGKTKIAVATLKREIHEAESGACYKSAPRLQALVAGKKKELAGLEARMATLQNYLSASPSKEAPPKDTAPKHPIFACRVPGV